LLERVVSKLDDIKTLAELRENKEFSQAEVANRLGITPQGYGAIERGERGLKAKNIKKLAEIFGVGSDRIIFLALNNNKKLLKKSDTAS
jgi:transcriptional regulator with XRE-family HTH domain